MFINDQVDLLSESLQEDVDNINMVLYETRNHSFEQLSGFLSQQILEEKVQLKLGHFFQVLLELKSKEGILVSGHKLVESSIVLLIKAIEVGLDNRK